MPNFVYARDRIGPRGNEPAPTTEQLKSVSFGKTFLRDMPQEAFVEIEHGMLPKTINGAMYSRVEALFTPDASPIVKGQPLNPGRMAIRAYASLLGAENDLVEYRWEYNGIDIRMVSSIDIVAVELDLAQIEFNAGFRMSATNYLRNILPKVINLEGKDRYNKDYQIAFSWPARLIDHVELSSGPNLKMNELIRWQDRVDVFVDGKRFCLLFYKKPDQFGYFRDGSKWFPDDFRHLVHEKAREQGKLPPEDPKSEE